VHQPRVRPAPSPTRWRRLAASLGAVALLTAACGAETDPASDAEAEGDGELTELSLAIASFDLAAGEDRRLMAGVFSPDRQLVGGGELEFGLAFLGEDEADMEAEIEQTVTASFLGVPGIEPEAELGERPTLLEDTGSGVYAAEVDLDRAGLWGLRVVAELEDGTVVSGQQSFQVLEEPEVPDVGDEAPAVENLTLEDVEAGEAAPVALDSRAQQEDDEIPDPQLHETTVAAAIEAGRPVVVGVTTPVYCATRFCGPLTEVLADLSEQYDDRADFVHLEVWEDFDEGELNEAAAAFIQTEFGGNEPWVFLVGDDGTIEARWDNVVDIDELEARLDALPTLEAVADGGGR
jgi:hypothetical protein